MGSPSRTTDVSGLVFGETVFVGKVVRTPLIDSTERQRDRVLAAVTGAFTSRGAPITADVRIEASSTAAGPAYWLICDCNVAPGDTTKLTQAAKRVPRVIMGTLPPASRRRSPGSMHVPRRHGHRQPGHLVGAFA